MTRLLVSDRIPILSSGSASVKVRQQEIHYTQQERTNQTYRQPRVEMCKWKKREWSSLKRLGYIVEHADTGRQYQSRS